MLRFTCLFILFGIGSSFAQKPLLTDSILVEGHYRTFHFLKPPKPNATLIFVLHGSGGDGLGIRKGASKLEEKSDTENLLLVYPDGYKRYWNECRKTANSAANLENINENSFFGEMITYFDTKYKINVKQIFAIGTSGGGHMAYKLALTMPEKFRAISALIANLPDTNNLDCPEKRVPIPVMIVNGTDDKVNPYNGGEVITGTISLGLVRSTDRTFSYWASLAGYQNKPVKELLPDTDPADGKTIERYTYKLRGKPEITLLKVLGGKHDYPNDINVYLESWNFFKRQLMP
ncbi:alpha/beta hydrolase family esterase [Spirosoma endbachense]|uniref:Poly(3-hydroxybutyrate) depolymerase n=1 Tax=Spirosoma endbachense TaxID=2666025 RepID=A0A6P1VZ16_9BACT|nr:poly(3-hydroxybutyrate) depolymerase [Spirosoma endbachense]QHV98441.1 poly(3-hydroxybutyrate) depolymerase [Spirosoma endbachense]